MATGQTGGATYAPPAPATPKDQPGRAPTGPAPLKPALTHLEQPHPVLQAAGFTGGIQAFNDRVQQVVDAHRHAYGTDPSPGLTLDVAKSTADPTHLFSVPLSPLVARAQATLTQHQAQNPDDYYQPDEHGFLQPQTSFGRMLGHGAPQDTTISGTHPGMVSPGNIDLSNRPVAHNADGSISTVRSISIGVNGTEVLIPTVVNGKVVSDDAAIAHYKQTGENLGTFASVAAANRYAQNLHNEQAAAYLPQTGAAPAAQVQARHRDAAPTQHDLQAAHPWVPAQAGFLPIDNFGGFVNAFSRLEKTGPNPDLENGQTLAQFEQQAGIGTDAGGKPRGGVYKLEAQSERGVFVDTVKKAQDELKTKYPAWFGQLAATGDYNQDWARATTQFQSSATYYRDSTLRLAKDNHFDNAHDFAKAWANRTAQIKKDPLARQFYERIPLAWFGNGQSVLNSIDGDTHGWGYLNLPTVGLHTISGLAKATVGTAGALVAQWKADSAAFGEYLNHVAPKFLGGHGESSEDARAHAAHVLQQNPTWLRVVYPDLPDHPTGALAAADALSNFTLDLVIGNKLVIGGSAVKAGDYAALSSNRYFKGATQLAFNAARKDGVGAVGEMSKLVQGGETLNVAVADSIKNGEMTVGQYRAHVADLYHHGQTAVQSAVAGPTPELLSSAAGGFKINEAALAREWEQLGRPPVKVSLLEAPPGETLRGFYSPKDKTIEVYVRPDSTEDDLSQVISHELRHAWQEEQRGAKADLRFAGDQLSPYNLKPSERDARKFAKTGTARLVIPEGETTASMLPVEPLTLHVSETPNASVLTTLREKNLPNPSLKHAQIKKSLDSFDAALRNNGFTGTDNAASAISAIRQQVARAAPRDARRIYDPKTPEDLYNWVVVNLKDRKLAYKARNDFVVARAKQDIPAIQELNQSLLERYAAEYPNVKGKPSPLEDSLGPQLESESLANLKFISGRQKDDVAFANLRAKAQRINDALLSTARLHRQVIISGAPIPGGESLFYKHMVADSLRRMVGGGGLRFALDSDQKLTRGEVRAFFKENPSALSDYSANRASAEIGEVAYLTRNRAATFENFNTGDALADPKRLEGAGAYLRHLVTDDALNAYRQSTPTNKEALFRHVWHSSFYQNKITASEDFIRDAATLKQHITDPARLRAELSGLKKSYAQDYADALWQQFRAIDEAGAKANVPNALEQAAQVAREHPGAKIDKALGQFVKDNSLSFDVREAPVKGKQFDGLMNAWTGKLLTFNKLNRVTMFDHVFYDSYAELKAAGWEKPDAIAAATSLAKAQTVYHMLDFSNMLQVEQKLRWLSYYATKHRLYWTWIGKQFIRKPALAAAVQDIEAQLDPRGNAAFTLFGHRLVLPASRLVWANNTEYPETSPLVGAGVELGKNVYKGESAGNAIADAFAAQTATSGNVITRQDQGIADLAKYLGVLTGTQPATYGLAVDGMSPIQRAGFNKEMHGYILAYRADHDGAYPSEANAVKATLARTTFLEAWRSNLFVPVLPDTSQPTDIQKLHQQFDGIRNPAKRRQFLADHPELQDTFGASGDQGLYLHEQPLWDRFNKLNAAREAQLEKVRLQVDAHGYNAQTAADVKAISATYSKEIQKLRALDAMTWKGNATYPAGSVADNGEIAVPGPWSQQLDGDPLAAKAFVHEAFPDISKGQLDAHAVGQTVIDLQNESTRIKQLGWQKLGYPDAQHARDRLSQISQKLDVFRSFPKTATQQMVSDYYSKFIDPYRKERDAWVARLAATPSSDKNKVFADFRAWKETHDHAVTVTDPANGKKVTFPSPASWGFSQLPPDEYKQALAQAASSRWQDISGYEKTLLGVKTPPDVAAGWSLYEKTLTDWGQDPANAGKSIGRVQKASVARQIDKYHPGFYKDYLFAQQPKIVRYESTSLYQNMPSEARAKFDSVIGSAAKAFANAAKQGGRSYYMDHWRDAVKTTILPWLDEPAQKPLKAELQSFGPRWIDFLNTLPTAG